MALRNDLYLAVSNKLDQLNRFEWIDLYKAQLDNKNEAYPTGFPCAFVSVSRIQYEDMTMNAQEGNAQVDVWLFFNKGGDTFMDAADKSHSLEVVDITDEVVRAIQWLEGDTFTPLQQTGDVDITEQFKRPAYKLSFTTETYTKLINPHYVTILN